jgi:hypothetical protein
VYIPGHPKEQPLEISPEVSHLQLLLGLLEGPSSCLNRLLPPLSHPSHVQQHHISLIAAMFSVLLRIRSAVHWHFRRMSVAQG